MAEPILLPAVKDYLRVLDAVEDDKIQSMVPRARLWVEEYTGLALERREFTELHRPRGGRIRLTRGPLVSVEGVDYVDSAGDDQVYVPHYQVPQPILSAGFSAPWPSLPGDSKFSITFVAGYADDEIDDRLLGAILALIEGEYSDGFAYPDRAIEAAKNCLTYLRIVA